MIHRTMKREIPGVVALERLQEFPTTEREITKAVNARSAVTAVHKGRVLGAGFFYRKKVQGTHRILEIARIIVAPEHRLVGLSERIIGSADAWFDALGFKAVGVETDKYWRYNRYYDGYKFEREL